MNFQIINHKFQTGKLQVGFTLVELIVSMGILAVIFAISTIVLSSVIPNTSQSNAVDFLISDVRTEQTQAMTNDSSYGIHFETTSYTIFKGTTYSASDPENYVVNLDPTLAIANVSFSGSQIVFSPGSGNVTSGNGSLDLQNTQTGKITNIKINQYGATY